VQEDTTPAPVKEEVCRLYEVPREETKPNVEASCLIKQEEVEEDKQIFVEKQEETPVLQNRHN
jgi:hypothetical protein